MLLAHTHTQRLIIKFEPCFKRKSAKRFCFDMDNRNRNGILCNPIQYTTHPLPLTHFNPIFIPLTLCLGTYNNFCKPTKDISFLSAKIEFKFKITAFMNDSIFSISADKRNKICNKKLYTFLYFCLGWEKILLLDLRIHLRTNP